MNLKILGDPFGLSGYSKCCRDLILALSQKHDVSVVYQSDRVKDVRHVSSSYIESLCGRTSAAEISIQVGLPQGWSKITKYNVGYFFYEASALPEPWVEKCNGMSAIFAPSEFVARVCRDSGVIVPIRVVGAPFFPVVTDGTYDIDLSQYAVKFLSIFQWDFRKGWDLLLRSYWSEFLHVKDVVLVIKTYLHTAEPKELDQILQQINGLKAACGIRVNNRDYCVPPPIKIIVDNLTDEQIKDLYGATDIFVLPTRGEGLGRIFRDAIYYGNPVVATNYSAHTEFLGEDFYRVDYNMSPCVNGSGDINYGSNYPMTSMCAEPHCDSLMSQMRLAYQDIKSGTSRFVSPGITSAIINKNFMQDFDAAIMDCIK